MKADDFTKRLGDALNNYITGMRNASHINHPCAELDGNPRVRAVEESFYEGGTCTSISFDSFHKEYRIDIFCVEDI